MEMFKAIESGDVDGVLRLLNADPTLLEKVAYGYWGTPLVHAAYWGQLALVKVLTAKGANIHATSSTGGQTALHYAAREGREELVGFLLDNGARLGAQDAGGCTPLMLASMGGHARVVLLLLEHMGGQGLEAQSTQGLTALEVAMRCGHEEVVAHLLEHGARTDIVRQYRGSIVRIALFLDRVGVMKVLVDHLGPHVLQERDQEGRSLLHVAVAWRRDDGVAYLLGRGLLPSITDNHGMTPLMYCARVEDNKIRVYGTRSESKWMMRRLLSHTGRDELDAKDFVEGKTALHWAVDFEKDADVRALLLAGADPTIVDNYGHTARELAEDDPLNNAAPVFKVSHDPYDTVRRSEVDSRWPRRV
jgi:ankyrin repeat protein